MSQCPCHDSPNAQVCTSLHQGGKGLLPEHKARTGSCRSHPMYLQLDEDTKHKLWLAETKAASARNEADALQKQLQRERDEQGNEVSTLQLKILAMEESMEGTANVLAQELKTCKLRVLRLDSDLDLEVCAPAMLHA